MTVARTIVIPIIIVRDTRTPEQKAADVVAAYGEERFTADVE